MMWWCRSLPDTPSRHPLTPPWHPFETFSYILTPLTPRRTSRGRSCGGVVPFLGWFGNRWSSTWRHTTPYSSSLSEDFLVLYYDDDNDVNGWEMFAVVGNQCIWWFVMMICTRNNSDSDLYDDDYDFELYDNDYEPYKYNSTKDNFILSSGLLSTPGISHPQKKTTSFRLNFQSTSGMKIIQSINQINQLKSINQSIHDWIRYIWEGNGNFGKKDLTFLLGFYVSLCVKRWWPSMQ